MKVCSDAFFLLIFSIVFVCCTSAHAEIYKWTDEQGNVHYTDKPPPKQSTEEVAIDRAPTPSRSSTAAVARQPDSNEGAAEQPSDRELCSDAIRNFRRFAPHWERMIKARMTDASEDKESIEKTLTEFRGLVREARTGLNQCVKEIDESDNRRITECMATAPDHTIALFCVM